MRLYGEEIEEKYFFEEESGSEKEKKSAESDKKVYNTAAYVRLSSITETNGESIENQIDIIKEFADAYSELKLIDIYSDAGKSGTDFERPEFTRLMNDVKSGRIDCIIVKNLSRFGRNFAETGNYIERIFPYLNVRFISVSDNFDTNSSDGNSFMIAFKNLINEFYARDLSEKIKSALMTKQLAGKYLGSVPYGYKKDPKDKYNIIPDEPAAAVVRRIFQMIIDGKSCSDIAYLLNAEKVPSPANYKRKDGKILTYWNCDIVGKIVAERIYTGCYVGRKTKRCSFSSKKRIKVEDEKEKIIIEDKFEAVVSKEDFAKVSKIMSERKKTIKMPRNPEAENVFKNITYCGLCGGKFAFHTKNKYSPNSLYVCNNHYRAGYGVCTNRKCVNYKQIKSAVFNILKNMLMLRNSLYERENTNIAEDNAQSDKLTQDKIKKNKIELIEMYSKGEISQEIYILEMDNLNKLETDITSENTQTNNKNISKVPRDGIFDSFTEKDMSKELVKAFISRIVIDEDGNVEVILNYNDFLRE